LIPVIRKRKNLSEWLLRLGIAVTSASIIVMPLLADAKRKVGERLGSAAMQADSKPSQFCMWLSAIVLAGLVLNAAFGMW